MFYHPGAHLAVSQTVHPTPRMCCEVLGKIHIFKLQRGENVENGGVSESHVIYSCCPTDQNAWAFKRAHKHPGPIVCVSVFYFAP